ncbi:MAG TPA: hypothetical protein VIK37_01065 [Candidatus Saccharimonadales bacterium]
MSDNETLIAPAQTDAIGMPPAEASYTYQRADGTVERAFSAEDAIARCPVLGRLAIEAPEQVNTLLELAALGKEKIEKENKEEPDKPKLEEKIEVEQEPKTNEPKKQITDTNTERTVKPEPVLEIQEHSYVEQGLATKPVNTATNHQAEPIMKQAQSEVTQRDVKETIEQTSNVTPLATQGEKTEISPSTTQPQVIVKNTDRRTIVDRPEQTDAFSHQQQYETDAVKPVVAELEIVKSSTIREPEPEIVLASDSNDTLNESYDESADLEGAIVAMPETEPTIAEADFIDEDYPRSELDLAPHELIIENEPEMADMQQKTEAYIDEQLRALFEPETVETYKELLALTAANQEGEPSVFEEATIVGPVLEADAETATPSDFEAFVATQPISEEPVTLEAIQEEANEQPLEQTLVQLVELLSGAPEKADAETEENKLYAILQGIEDAMPACYIGQEAAETKPRITAEMTEKLLRLLRALGYENPKEVLVSFVARFDLAFLLQTLKYLCQLNNEHNRQEFLAVFSTFPANDDDDTRLRIGKMLFGLIAKLSPEPSV